MIKGSNFDVKKGSLLLDNLDSDFEMEFERAKLNKELVPEIETLFITCRPELFYTSEMVKEIAAFGGSVRCLVPPYVEACLLEKMMLDEQREVEMAGA